MVAQSSLYVLSTGKIASTGIPLRSFAFRNLDKWPSFWDCVQFDSTNEDGSTRYLE